MVLAVLVLLTLTTSAAAHMGNRLYPIPEISDEMLERIRFDDESVDEWYELVGEPTMSLIDFQYNNTDLPDPSSLDFRIWIAWHDDPVRIYLAFSASDDVHISSRGMGSDIEIILAVDADHSGGEGGYSNLSFEEAEGSWGGAQQYRAFSWLDSGEPALHSLYTSSREYGGGRGYIFDGSGDSWTVLPPYGDAVSHVAGENPTITLIELYVTPYDSWGGYDSGPQDAEVSDLKAGQVIGFATIVTDSDSEDGHYNLMPEAVQSERPWGDIIAHYRADVYLDGLLLPTAGRETEDSAVRPSFWGLIKASLRQ